MRTVASSWKAIEEILRESAIDAYRSLRKPVSGTDLKRLENTFPGRKLPGDLLQSLAIHDGMNASYLGPTRLFNYWALLPATAMVRAAKAERDVMAMLENDGLNPKAKTGPVRADLRWRDRWIPILDADGDKILIDMDPGTRGRVGQVIRFYNSQRQLSLIAPSFREWLSRLAVRLESGEFKTGGVHAIAIRNARGLE